MEPPLAAAWPSPCFTARGAVVPTCPPGLQHAVPPVPSFIPTCPLHGCPRYQLVIPLGFLLPCLHRQVQLRDPPRGAPAPVPTLLGTSPDLPDLARCCKRADWSSEWMRVEGTLSSLARFTGGGPGRRMLRRTMLHIYDDCQRICASGGGGCFAVFSSAGFVQPCRGVNVPTCQAFRRPIQPPGEPACISRSPQRVNS